MLTITITETQDVDNDLEKLNSLKTIFECFSGDDEVHLKIDQTHRIVTFRLPQKINVNLDMLELLYSIDNIEVEI